MLGQGVRVRREGGRAKYRKNHAYFRFSLAPGSVRVFTGSHRQTLLEGFLPAVSRSSDKYESTPATRSLYFVIFGRIVGLVAVSHSEAASEPKSPPAASRGHNYWGVSGQEPGEIMPISDFPRPGFDSGLHRIT